MRKNWYVVHRKGLRHDLGQSQRRRTYSLLEGMTFGFENDNYATHSGQRGTWSKLGDADKDMAHAMNLEGLSRNLDIEKDMVHTVDRSGLSHN